MSLSPLGYVDIKCKCHALHSTPTVLSHTHSSVPRTHTQCHSFCSVTHESSSLWISDKHFTTPFLLFFLPFCCFWRSAILVANISWRHSDRFMVWVATSMPFPPSYHCNAVLKPGPKGCILDFLQRAIIEEPENHCSVERQRGSTVGWKWVCLASLSLRLCSL